MKRNTLLGFGLVIFLIGGFAYTYLEDSNTVRYTKEPQSVATTTVEAPPEWTLDEDAVQAAKDVVKRKELEAKEAELVEEITSKQAELDAVRKELGVY